MGDYWQADDRDGGPNDDDDCCDGCERCAEKLEVAIAELTAPEARGARVRCEWTCPGCGRVEVTRTVDEPWTWAGAAVVAAFWAALAAMVVTALLTQRAG